MFWKGDGFQIDGCFWFPSLQDMWRLVEEERREREYLCVWVDKWLIVFLSFRAWFVWHPREPFNKDWCEEPHSHQQQCWISVCVCVSGNSEQNTTHKPIYFFMQSIVSCYMYTEPDVITQLLSKTLQFNATMCYWRNLKSHGRLESPGGIYLCCIRRWHNVNSVAQLNQTQP